jgi:hypothetical protein
LRPGLRAVSPFGLIGKRVQPGSEFNQEAFQDKRVQPKTTSTRKSSIKKRFNPEADSIPVLSPDVVAEAALF